MSITLTLERAWELARAVLEAHGASAENAAILAELIVAAESAGTRSHGLMRLPDYLASIRAGWLVPDARPSLRQTDTPFITADGNNGFTQAAAWLARQPLLAALQTFGFAALSVRNGHHIGALWPDIEYFAERGYVAFNFVNSRARLAPYGAAAKLLGTNAMAFACPDGRGGVFSWDQASSVMSLGDIKLYRQRGEALPEGVGLDRAGRPTTDPTAVLDQGALLPFGAHKGASVALMVEIMAAALTGGRFGFEDDSAAYPGAASSNAGQFLLLIDPARTSSGSFPARVGGLFDYLRQDAALRLPGDQRRKLRARALAHGLTFSRADYESLRRLLPPDAALHQETK